MIDSTSFFEFPKDDPILHKIPYNFLCEMTKTQMVCPLCNRILLLKLLTNLPLTIVNQQCFCGYKKSVSLLSFLHLNDISKKIIGNYIEASKDMKQTETETSIKNLIKRDQDQKILAWNYFIQNHKICEIFNIKPNKFCSVHNDLPIEYYCKKCGKHFCLQCVDNHNVENNCDINDRIELKTYLDSTQFTKRLNLFKEIYNIRIKTNKEIFTQTTSLITINIAKLIGSPDKLPEYLTVILSEANLARFYNIISDVNEQLKVFYTVLIDIAYSQKKPINYYILQNIKENWNFCLDDFIFDVKRNFGSSIDNIEAYVARVISYYSNHLYIQSNLSQNEIESTFINYEKYVGVNTKTIKEIKQKENIKYGQHNTKLNHILILGNGKLAVCGNHPTIKVFNINNLEVDMKFKGHKESVNYLANLDANHFLSCSDDKQIIKWELKSSLFKSEFGLKLSSAFSHKTVIKGNNEGLIQLLVVNKGMFISLSKHEIKVWHDGKEPSLFTTFNENTSEFVSMELLPDANIITASKDDTLRVWNLKLLKEEKERKVKGVNCFRQGSMKMLNKNILIIGGTSTITIVDINKYRISQIMNNIDSVTSLLILSNNSFLSLTTKTFIGFKYSFDVLEKTYEYNHNCLDTPTSMTELSGKNEMFTCGFDFRINKWKISI